MQVIRDIDFLVREANYSFWDVYQMPIRIREFLVRQMADRITQRNNKILENQNKAREFDAKSIKTLKERLSPDKVKSPPFITHKAPPKK